MLIGQSQMKNTDYVIRTTEEVMTDIYRDLIIPMTKIQYATYLVRKFNREWRESGYHGNKNGHLIFMVFKGKLRDGTITGPVATIMKEKFQQSNLLD